MTAPITDERLAVVRAEAERQRLMGLIDLADLRGLLARLDRAEELLREVRGAGRELDDERMRYVVAQIGRDILDGIDDLIGLDDA